MHTAIQHERLCKNPSMQNEAIVRHYARHARMACEMLTMIDCARNTGSENVIDNLVGYLVTKIKEAHATELGIPLEWPVPETQKEGGTR